MHTGRRARVVGLTCRMITAVRSHRTGEQGPLGHPTFLSINGIQGLDPAGASFTVTPTRADPCLRTRWINISINIYLHQTDYPMIDLLTPGLIPILSDSDTYTSRFNLISVFNT